MNEPHAHLVAKRNARLAALGPPPPWHHFRKVRAYRIAWLSIMAMDVSQAAAMLRELYSPEKINALVDRPSPLATFTRSRS